MPLNVMKLCCIRALLTRSKITPEIRYARLAAVESTRPACNNPSLVDTSFWFHGVLYLFEDCNLPFREKNILDILCLYRFFIHFKPINFIHIVAYYGNYIFCFFGLATIKHFSIQSFLLPPYFKQQVICFRFLHVSLKEFKCLYGLNPFFYVDEAKSSFLLLVGVCFLSVNLDINGTRSYLLWM